MAISPLSVFLKRTFMLLVLSVVDACRSLPSLEGPAKVVDCEAALDRDDGGLFRAILTKGASRIADNLGFADWDWQSAMMSQAGRCEADGQRARR
jgi:hypothetical protein